MRAGSGVHVDAAALCAELAVDGPQTSTTSMLPSQGCSLHRQYARHALKLWLRLLHATAITAEQVKQRLGAWRHLRECSATANDAQVSRGAAATTPRRRENGGAPYLPPRACQRKSARGVVWEVHPIGRAAHSTPHACRHGTAATGIKRGECGWHVVR